MLTVARKINICLHNIVPDSSSVRTIYDLTFDQLDGLTATLKGLIHDSHIDTYDIFFDDGYQSFRGAVEKVDFGIERSQVHAAVITEQIGKEGKLTSADLKWASEQGYSIDSHGVSHAALAIFRGGELQRTGQGGEYRNMPYGKGAKLTENEVLYQLKESALAIEKNTNYSSSSFVLPYGLYNYSTVVLAAIGSNYKRVYTCDVGLDSGQYLAPRLLITQDNIGSIKGIINKLSSEVEPLAGGLKY